MLGLLAHSLHALLVVLGLAGVVALLLPQLLEARHRRHATYRPPANPTEHQERVAALRSAVRAGLLTVPTVSDPPVEPRPLDRDGSLWRVVAVSSSLAAAVVHAAVFPHHLQEGLLLGAFFFLAAVAQGVWAYLVARDATSRLLLGGVIGSLALIALWAVTRTVGLPFGLIQGREEVGGWDLAAGGWEVCVVLACRVGLRTSSETRHLPLGRLGTHAWLWVLLSVSILVLLSLTVAHE